ncbi:hypothetical protein EIM48_03075 [Pseudoxanthomonas sp. SGNA-20]|jgi:Membrane protein required for beta-lactamase induction|uniref:AmpE protein n=1 Tax=Pseudoxanthomonas taiwanensis J19 TaxID=935569 RepID=A0A562D6H5_9GAMM|nr:MULTISPECIES: membrane protein [Pseudoxanthomonas]RRN59037.1 hypothetical protein EIM48_03075 [Pseudoxanthomonas sp. SGNA-20]TWH05162.1 AmpE protein [Pseudoxanthomonas taiwanensis J19]
MFTTLVAVIIALVLGHVAPAVLAPARSFGWYARWQAWLAAQLADGGPWRTRWGIALAVLPPVLLVLALQLALGRVLYGLPGLLFGVLVLVLAWGPRDLDVDVEAVLDAEDPATRKARLDQLAAEPGQVVAEGPGLPAVMARAALRRWFAVLFWFLLLGPAGAVLYRLLERSAFAGQVRQLPEDNAAGLLWLLRWMEWPVAQLMTLALALAGNFDLVSRAWRHKGGAGWNPESRFLEAAARAAVVGELAEEDAEDLEAGRVPARGELAELRDAMNLIWRALLLWLAVLALLILAGWAG